MSIRPLTLIFGVALIAGALWAISAAASERRISSVERETNGKLKTLVHRSVAPEHRRRRIAERMEWVRESRKAVAARRQGAQAASKPWVGIDF